MAATRRSLTEVIQELRSRFQVERFRDNGKERGKNKFVSFTFCIDGLC